jgi:hypothetical protein
VYALHLGRPENGLRHHIRVLKRQLLSPCLRRPIEGQAIHQLSFVICFLFCTQNRKNTIAEIKLSAALI